MKTAIVTGASGAIGAAVCRALAERYAVVVIYHQSEGRARLVCDELRGKGGEAVCFRADVADSAGADALADFTL